MVHNSNNEVGVYQYYDGTTGATGARIEAELRMTFTPADSAVAGSAASIIEVPDLYDIGVTAASGAVNRKTVTSDPGKVVLSDWSTIDLTENSTAFEGVTIVDNKIVCSVAKKFKVFGALWTENEGSGGGARAYNMVRLVKVGSPDVFDPTSQTASYQKTTDPDVGDQAILSQGPRNQIA